MSLPILVIILAVLVALGCAAWFYHDRQRSLRMRGRYGREYERTVEQEGDRRKAERILREREQRVEMLRLRPLIQEDQDRFSKEWQDIQNRFVDDPKAVVTEADWLVHRVMRARRRF